MRCQPSGRPVNPVTLSPVARDGAIVEKHLLEGSESVHAHHLHQPQRRYVLPPHLAYACPHGGNAAPLPQNPSALTFILTAILSHACGGDSGRSDSVRLGLQQPLYLGPYPVYEIRTKGGLISADSILQSPTG